MNAEGDSRRRRAANKLLSGPFFFFFHPRPPPAAARPQPGQPCGGVSKGQRLRVFFPRRKRPSASAAGQPATIRTQHRRNKQSSNSALLFFLRLRLLLVGYKKSVFSLSLSSSLAAATFCGEGFFFGIVVTASTDFVRGYTCRFFFFFL